MPAVLQVRRLYLSRPEWERDVRSGKMFGVLVYDFELLNSGSGYLAAFSGTLGGQTIQPGFVPPVFDLMHSGSWFREEEANISALNHQIDDILDSHRGEEICGEDGRLIADLRHERKVRSQALQQWLFSQYTFYNIKGVGCRMQDLFTAGNIPSGTGDCCAPKLLQEAFRLSLKPLAVVEWNSADDRFYPPCMERCYPLLRHMLDGLNAEPDPRMEYANAVAAQLHTVYEDDDILLVNKPSGLLSVPGKEFYPNVMELTGCLVVHRLDQDTSGLMLLAKNRMACSALQRQFERREVRKMYIALLERPMEISEGDIRLPLRPDIDNLPHQMVDVEHGRSAITHYQIVGNTPDGHARVLLYPQTGRTHQLRVHCSSTFGLDNPILGDRLYGKISASRLMLHAEIIRFAHPTSGRIMNFDVSTDW